MVAWEFGVPIGPQLCVATGVFFCDVLQMLLSEFDEGLPSLDIEERSCVSGMFVIIMSAEPSRRIDFVT